MNGDHVTAVAHCVGEKLGHPHGLRFFSDDHDLRTTYGDRASSIEAQLKRVAGVRCLWPEGAGEVPADDVVGAWVKEWQKARAA